MKKTVTQKDIAERLGISQRTVATVVGKGSARSGVSKELRRKIEDTARELGYRPHRGAQLMKGARSGLIGHLKSPSYYEHHIATGIYFGEAMAAKGYEVLAMDIQRGFKGLERALEFFRDIGVEGLLFTRGSRELESSEVLRVMTAAGIPVVCLAEAPQLQLLAMHTVVSNHGQGTSLLTAHLLEQGLRRIAMVVVAGAPQDPVRKRIAAYESTMREAGLEPDLVEVERPDMESSVGLNMSLGWRGMEMLLRRPHLPEAVCFGNDHYAAGGLALCSERGISVPGDLALAGFGNYSLAEYSRPAITSVELPVRDVAAAAAELLTRLVRGEEDRARPHHLRLPCRLHVRESSSLRDSGSENLTMMPGSSPGETKTKRRR